MSTNHGNYLSIATALFFSWSSLSLLVRVWVKSRKGRWAWEDSIVCAAFFLILGHITTILLAVSDGYGGPLGGLDPETVETINKSMYASQITYVVAMGLTRVSASLFIGHVTRYLPQVKMAWGITGLAGAWTVGACLAIALGGDLAMPWNASDTDHGLWIRWVVVETTGLGVELAIWVMSVSMIWGLKMKTYKRMIILGAFGCRLGLIPLVVARIVYLSPSINNHPTESDVIPGILTEAALEYALFSCSVTALKPFWRPFYSGAIVNTYGGAGSGLAYASRQQYTGNSSRECKDFDEEFASDLPNIVDIGGLAGRPDLKLIIPETPKVGSEAGFPADGEDMDIDKITTITHRMALGH